MDDSPIHYRGVFYANLGSRMLCDACGNAIPHPAGGRTCGADALKITMTRTCRDWRPVTPADEADRAFRAAVDDAIAALSPSPIP